MPTCSALVVKMLSRSHQTSITYYVIKLDLKSQAFWHCLTHSHDSDSKTMLSKKGWVRQALVAIIAMMMMLMMMLLRTLSWNHSLWHRGPTFISKNNDTCSQLMKTASQRLNQLMQHILHVVNGLATGICIMIWSNSRQQCSCFMHGSIFLA